MQQLVGTFAEAIAVARNILQQLGQTDPPLEVAPTLLQYAEKVSGKKVSIITKNLDPAKIRGFIVVEPHSARIVVDHSLNRCWKRFTIAKELVHLMVDTEDHRADSASSQLAAAFNMRIPTNAKDQLDSEAYALFVAVELMFPFGQRPDGRPISDLKVARRFLIPQFYVDRFYGTGWGALSNKVHRELAQL